MRNSETALRQIIREVILNDGFRLTNAPRQPIAPGEPLLAMDAAQGKEDYKYDPPTYTKAAHKIKSNYVPNDQLNAWFKIHWEDAAGLASEILRWNTGLEKSVFMYRDRSLVGYVGISPTNAIRRDPGDIGILLSGGYVTQVFSGDAYTQYIKTQSGWRYYPQSDFDSGIDANLSKIQINKTGDWSNRRRRGESWTVTPDEVPVGIVPEATLVGAIPIAVVITCQKPLDHRAPKEFDKLLDDLTVLDMPILNDALEPVTIDYLRTWISTSRKTKRVPVSNTKYDELNVSLKYTGENENDKVPSFVNGNFVVRNTPITQLPDSFHVSGDLIADYPLESLPSQLRVDGNLLIYSHLIEKLPVDVSVGRDVKLGENITTLPNNFHVKGALDVSAAEDRFHFPAGLQIDGDLHVHYDTPMLPNDIVVGRRIIGYGTNIAKARQASPILRRKII